MDMITLLETLNFRCLKYVSQELGPFHVLVGPNASGKTTFLDVIVFLGDLVSNGLDFAVNEKTQNFSDLVSGHADISFELAVEARIPDERRKCLDKQPYDIIRYEIRIGIDRGEIAILSERTILKAKPRSKDTQVSFFPSTILPPKTILAPQGQAKQSHCHK